MAYGDKKSDFTKERAASILLEHSEKIQESIDDLKIQIDGLNSALYDYFARYDEPWKKNDENLTNDHVIEKLNNYSFFIDQFLEKARYDIASAVCMDLMYEIEQEENDQ